MGQKVCVQLSHFSCIRLCELMDYSPPRSSIHGISLARTLEWVAMPSSRRSSQPRDRTQSLLSLALADEFFTNSATCDGKGQKTKRSKVRKIKHMEMTP